jgi:hypothetical protein
MSTDVATWLASSEGQWWSECVFPRLEGHDEMFVLLRLEEFSTVLDTPMRGPLNPHHDPAGRPPIRRQTWT